METWYSKVLGDGLVASGLSDKIQEAFLAFSKNGINIDDVAVFTNYDLNNNVVSVYFTPSATLLAKIFNANPCKKPVPGRGFGLLVGDARSWEIHFPDYLNNMHKE